MTLFSYLLIPVLLYWLEKDGVEKSSCEKFASFLHPVCYYMHFSLAIASLPCAQLFFQITDQYSCDRISEAADESAKSINGKLDVVYMDNNQSPMKWQYFGSEYGIINQFPASKAPDCSSYDHRFRSVILIGLWKMLVFWTLFFKSGVDFITANG